MRFNCQWALLDNEVAADVEVTVTDGRFTRVEVGAAPRNGVQRRPGLSLPGLANAHSHAFHRALRGHTQADEGTFWTWRTIMYRVAERLDPDRYHRLARAVYGEMAMAGITSVGEFHYLHHSPDGSPYRNPNAMGEALTVAAADVGIRITLLDTLYQHGGLGPDGHQPVEGVQRRYRDASIDAWIDRLEDRPKADHVRLGAAVHSVRAVDQFGLTAAAEWLRQHDAPLHAHVSEQPAENDACLAYNGVTPTALLDSAGLVGPEFTAVHATHLTPDDIDRLARGGATVCFCPTTERDLGDGIGPSSELHAAGSPISLGTDSHAVIDLLGETRLLELHERLRTGRRGLFDSLSLAAMATVNGHRCLGWDDAGRIAVGARADLVTIDLTSVRTAGGAESPLATAIFAAGAADVTEVLIDGRPVVIDRHHQRVDVAAELAAAIQELTNSV